MFFNAANGHMMFGNLGHIVKDCCCIPRVTNENVDCLGCTPPKFFKKVAQLEITGCSGTVRNLNYVAYYGGSGPYWYDVTHDYDILNCKWYASYISGGGCVWNAANEATGTSIVINHACEEDDEDACLLDFKWPVCGLEINESFDVPYVYAYIFWTPTNNNPSDILYIEWRKEFPGYDVCDQDFHDLFPITLSADDVYGSYMGEEIEVGTDGGICHVLMSYTRFHIIDSLVPGACVVSFPETYPEYAYSEFGTPEYVAENFKATCVGWVP